MIVYSFLPDKIASGCDIRRVWKTLFFVGQNGLVRSTHTGFTIRASGELDLRLKDDVGREIGRLLSENVMLRKAEIEIRIFRSRS